MKFLVLAALLALVAADGHLDAYPKAYYPSEHRNVYLDQPYSNGYAVKDSSSGNDYSLKESSDGRVVSGMYQVLLPDGRVQTVNYKADDHSGYVADVTYTSSGYPTHNYPRAMYTHPTYPSKY